MTTIDLNDVRVDLNAGVRSGDKHSAVGQLEIVIDFTRFALDAFDPDAPTGGGVEIVADGGYHGNDVSIEITPALIAAVFEIHARHVQWYRAWSVGEYGDCSPYWVEEA